MDVLSPESQLTYSLIRRVHRYTAEQMMMSLQGEASSLVTSHAFTAPQEAIDDGAPEHMTVIVMTMVVEGEVDQTKVFSEDLTNLCRPFFSEEAGEVTEFDGKLVYLKEH